jgi:hypothetical protein
MNFDLQIITPRAIEWADQHASRILDMGEPLVEKDLALARRVGVAKPEKIRLLFVMQLPLPTDQLLRDVALENGLLGPSIYIRSGCNSSRLLSHECRHVYQYEQAGSIAAYLPQYIQQIAEFGYTNAPYEVDACAHELAA